jgi:hypothetical protein
MGKTEGELRAYVEGNDPHTGASVMREVVDGLTQGLAANACPATEPYARSTPRLEDPDTEDQLRARCSKRTRAGPTTCPSCCPPRRAWPRCWPAPAASPDEVVGRMQPTPNRGLWEYTVEKVAVNAVMAGARPEYFPVILALASTGITARGSTSSSASVMTVVNGPIRHQIGMNCGLGAMGPYNACQRHHRAGLFSLLSQNLQGGSVPNETFMGSIGNNYTYNGITFAENEERSAPGSRCTCRRASTPRPARCPCFTAAARPPSTWACARTTGAST